MLQAPNDNELHGVGSVVQLAFKINTMARAQKLTLCKILI